MPEGYNPARGIEKYDEESRERLLSVEELERLGSAIREAETVGIPWEIDSSKKTKHVPKAEARDGDQRACCSCAPLADLHRRPAAGNPSSEVGACRFRPWLVAVAGFEDRQEGNRSQCPRAGSADQSEACREYVIAGDRAGTKDEKPRSDLKRPWDMIRRHAKLKGLRIHDLRHNFASFGAGGGMGLPIIGKLLGHTQAATTQRYAHLDADPLRRASNAIGNTIAAAMGEATQPSGDVVPWLGDAIQRTRRDRPASRQAGEHLPVSLRSSWCAREVRR